MRIRLHIFAFLLPSAVAATAQTMSQRLVVRLKNGDFAPAVIKMSVYDTTGVMLQNMETNGSPAVHLV